MTGYENSGVAHCRDCCCARSWKALGVAGYDGRSIPEHIAALREQLDAANDRCLTAQNSNAALRAQLVAERADHERIEEALKDKYHLLRAQLAEREEAAFRVGHQQGHRRAGGFVLWMSETEALAAWRASQKGNPWK